jgi:hypothetical protein
MKDKKPKNAQIVQLHLKPSVVKKIEKLLKNETVQEFLEREINETPDCFIEMMGLDNY